MDYFKQLLQLLKAERNEDREQYRRLTESTSIAERRADGLTWYPIAIRGSELGRGDYLTVEVERTTHQDIAHQFRVGTPAMLFSNHDSKNDRVEGTIAYQGGNRLKITLLTDELPDWSRDGKLGVELLFDDQSYDQMQEALQLANSLADKGENQLVRILTGDASPTFRPLPTLPVIPRLNESQVQAVGTILAANELAIVHGPPGTGKTTTLVQAIKALYGQDHKQILVVAPSNAAVDLLSEKLHDEGLRVLRVGNPARVSERLMGLTLDHQMADHRMMKDIKKLRKQASEFKAMAHKYKRSFGRAEREQRKALFDEAHRIMKDVAQIEQYIIDELLAQAQVITATLVGANQYLIRDRKYHTVVIDEAGQALEPACWIPILKAQKVVLAGDHCQLPPTIKSMEAARQGLATTLLEKGVAQHPEAVRLLNVQYRMHERIMGYSSAVFYGGQLQAHRSVATHSLLTGDLPLLFVDTAGCGFDEKLEGTSSTNPEEAAFLIRHLGLLAEELSPAYGAADFPSTAVISPYKAQLNLLADQLAQTPELAPLRARIAVNTIDSFQGQERDIVYISLTRSNDKGEIGFLSDIRRMNVAMTRARKKLVMIGDSATLATHSFYADLISYAQTHDGYRSAWDWM
ncbi:AAA domain-containing protein [Rudanella lutea]|uniref:AAA domain-containing protein n=1 Tax=Rudanella lutea TaxID=451374 RepID=UPI0003670E3C|nr:AAA domain-containing protein [Rudanella lutea]